MSWTEEGCAYEGKCTHPAIHEINGVGVCLNCGSRFIDGKEVVTRTNNPNSKD